MKSTEIYKGNMLFLFQFVAFFAYSINGYFLNKKFTFKDGKRKNPYLAYIAVMGPAAMFSALLIRTLTLYNIFNLSSSLWANIVIIFASISIGFISFLINKFLVFKS
jgi:putative flippase GtrA